MLTAWLLFAMGFLGLGLAANVLRPLYAPGSVAIVSFFAGWLAGELAPHAVLGLGIAGALLVHSGALAAWPGVVGLAATLGACALLAASHVRAMRARHVFERALRGTFGDSESSAPTEETSHWLSPALGIGHLALPFPVRHAEVTCSADLEFCRVGGVRLRLDVFRARARRHVSAVPKPTFVYVHGGAWMIGHRRRQGLPLLLHLAARGWVCFSVDYRLSPRATFPDHLVDVKRAIAWIREHAGEYGADPDFVVLGGNSAGGHLAALAALTANDPEYQPGFEASDTSVQACAAFYGVYDLLDRHGHWHHQGMLRLLERHVLKQKRSVALSEFNAASPIARVHPDAPPFLVVHGTHDSICPVAEARTFAETLRAASRQPVVYAEVPGAQHAFEIFPSVRTAHALDGVTRFLARVYQDRQARAELSPPRYSGFRRSPSQTRAAGT
jgi:acetyl esterase/lipase